MADGMTTSLADDIRAAWTEVDEEPAEAIESAPEASEPIEEAPSRSRDERGRFAPKEPEAEPAAPLEAKSPQAKAPPAVQPSEPLQALSPPKHWKPEHKAEFVSLPPALQKAILDNEGETDKARAELSERGQNYQRLEQVIGPRRQQWAMHGLDEATAVHQLLAVSDALNKDPYRTIAWLAQDRGVDIARLAAAMSGGQQQAPQGVNQQPSISPQDIQALVQRELQRAQGQTETARLEEEAKAFAADPKNIYFENVRQDMAQLLRAGAASDFKSAYEKACWARDDIRPLMLKEQAKADAERAKAEAAKAAQTAKRAAGSVIGSPGPGKAIRASNPNSSIKDDLLAAWAEHEG